MTRGLLLVPFLAVLMLGACSAKSIFGHNELHWKEQDFKPYLAGQEHAFPMAYGNESWAYPEGTPTQEIVRRWQQAGLINSVNSGGRTRFWSTPSGVLSVFVGPNFYNLSPSSQRGFAETLGQIYGVGQDGRQSYLLYDGMSGRKVGTYTQAHGLLTY